MRIVSVIQNTPEWHAHRAQHCNASDAPAMIGCSPYKTRTALIHEVKTGISQEVDAATQRRFDDGHRFEELARPLAEQIIGEELFPVTGTNGKLSASFDGLTMAGDTVFEHKSLNDQLRAAMVEGCTGDDLPLQYQVQMEQQLMVSGAERVLFMASKWNGNELVEERNCWYVSNPELRAKILAGWEQFEADVAAYVPEQATVLVTGRAPDSLPVLRIEVSGMVTASNLDEFKTYAMAALGSINRDLQTDEDFASAEQTVKWCKDAEDRLDAEKDRALSGMSDVYAVLQTLDSVRDETRKVRLELDKLVKAEKESRKAEIVQAGATAVRAHFDGINASLGEHRIQPAQTLTMELGNAIKGKKSLASMKDAIDTTVAAAKIEANQLADSIRACIAVLADYPDHAHLFADRVQLCTSKTPEDLRNLAKARIAEHQQREAEKLEAERERIRAEEAAKLQRGQQEEAARIEREQQAAAAPPVAQPSPAAAPVVAQVSAPATTPAPTVRIKLGDINAAIAPLSITADGLASLGFRPVGTERTSKLYALADLPHICGALARVVAEAPARLVQEEAA